MSRIITIGAAQLGPIQKEHSRTEVVERLIIYFARQQQHPAILLFSQNLLSQHSFRVGLSKTSLRQIIITKQKCLRLSHSHCLMKQSALVSAFVSGMQNSLQMDIDSTRRFLSRRTARSLLSIARSTYRDTNTTSQTGHFNMQSVTTSNLPWKVLGSGKLLNLA